MVIQVGSRPRTVALAATILALLACRPAAKQQIVFLCPHGSAKSLIAASYFNRLARAERQPYVAAAYAADAADARVPHKIAARLRQDGFDVRSFTPRKITPSDLAGARRVIAIGCDARQLGARGKIIERWDDVPMVDANLPASAAAIGRHVEALVKQLEAGGS